ncbi:uncharacterized protein DNG_07220 [Cephalotrichum gorgonifer]|uniref:Uncharacterized protein n=1 Tax=Cephalotrichum gorgonifer TaxID=2041049 RepID=A0AAE8N182_9PEZI|nr:uncharacterized protein DNG_07220 [Cephalotrichum gorgonifer]
MDVDDPDHDPADVFTQTFLLGGESDLPTLQAIWGPDAETRKKRAHRKSRWGCTACKRRKVKQEYFMTAMLAVAARHLSILNPSSRRHSEAALLLLSKSCAQFRADLDQAITVENRDARLGTALLLHYLGWCNVGFLEFQTASSHEQPLDLSGDQLFLLSEGLRHVRFLSWELPDLGDSIFGRFMANANWARRCGALKALLEEKGISARPLRSQIMDLFDDPRFVGTHGGGVPTPPPEGCWQQQQKHDSHFHGHFHGHFHPFGTPAGSPPPCLHACSDAHILSMIALRIPRKNPNEQTPAERALYTRLSFEIVADRLSVMLRICQLYESTLSEGSHLGVSEVLGAQAYSEIERCFLAFPILCYRPFCNLVVDGDSRALAVLYHVYRSARVLLGGPKGVWWAIERSEAMEVALGRELKRRGLFEALRDMNIGPVDSE